MKRLVVLAAAVMVSISAMAQKELAFPFQGGQEVMNSFFKQNFEPTNDITKNVAAGLVMLKFTADIDGNIKRIVVYYADDVAMAQPVADLLKKTDKKWIIPDHEKQHDFLLPVSINYNLPAIGQQAIKRKYLQFYAKRSPLLTNNQIPLDAATLLPTVTLSYDAVLQ
ncbi:hypothetical protein [Mucilaginibacter ginkgonis]|uniref:TonB-like protein n=1 Tax=Mucilaginibacter ginkgonis TaxID=2682091 RepID=A0A6I4HY62_9SPHI|nr:hypothetical protein [Mucilaginibacter ginkgonis]QQL49615.1 hypothetical protein GO620_015800 [Mucilaginibacter ginkgonis]